MDKAAMQPNALHSQQTDNVVSLLGVIASQIEAALLETNAPAATLVQTAHSLTSATQTIARCLFDFSGSPARVFQDLMVLHDHLDSQAGKASTAIQFHDRLVQCLTHVCSSLSQLTNFMSSDSAPKSAAEWNELKERVRGIHSMEQEQRASGDLLNGGSPSDEKQTAMAQHQASGAGKVELF
jgi:hypothetical protein